MGLSCALFWLVKMNDEQQSVLTLKLRVTPELKQKIVESAEKYNRSMNADMVSRLEKSFEPQQQQDNQADVKVINLKNGYKRLIYGKLVKVLGVDYTQDLSELRDDIELSLYALRGSSFIQKIAFINKEVIVYQGGHHIDIVNHGKGSLGWLRVEDHYVKDGLQLEESD